MKSVADELRAEDRQAVLALSPAERVRLALELGERVLRAYCDVHGLDREAGLRSLRRQGQAGRRASRCLEIPPE